MRTRQKATAYWDRSYTDGSFEEGSANITDIMVDDHTVTSYVLPGAREQ